MLCLLDNRAEDGGTLVVPGFHHVFPNWLSALGPEAAVHVRGTGPGTAGPDTGRSWLVPREGGGGSFKFAQGDPIYALGRRIPVRAGSLLIWDQRVVHGSQPNESNRCRISQFVRAVRRDGVSASRLERRTAAVQRELRAAGTHHLLTPLGRRVFGLE